MSPLVNHKLNEEPDHLFFLFLTYQKHVMNICYKWMDKSKCLDHTSANYETICNSVQNLTASLASSPAILVKVVNRFPETT